MATDFMVVTEPIPEPDRADRVDDPPGLGDCRDMLYYLRRTDDDRIAIGGGALGVVFGDRIGGRPGGRPGLPPKGRAATSRRLAEVAAAGLTWLFPPLAGVRFTHAWSGPMDLTPPGLPFFDTWPRGNVHAGLGFSGHGLVPTRVGGKTLASLVLGADDEWSRLPVVGPPLVARAARTAALASREPGVVGVRTRRPRRAARRVAAGSSRDGDRRRWTATRPAPRAEETAAA